MTEKPPNIGPLKGPRIENLAEPKRDPKAVWFWHLEIIILVKISYCSFTCRLTPYPLLGFPVVWL